MTLNQEISVIGSWFILLFVENNGMAFGWLGGGGLWKLALSLFRIVAIVVLLWILIRQSKKGTKFGVLFGIALITAGAMGNIIDSVFYGRIFSESTFTKVATLFPDGGGYAGWLHGRVVDMLYFPIIDVARENATWLPDFFFGPDGHFIFFRPIFNHPPLPNQPKAMPLFSTNNRLNQLPMIGISWFKVILVFTQILRIWSKSKTRKITTNDHIRPRLPCFFTFSSV